MAEIIGFTVAVGVPAFVLGLLAGIAIVGDRQEHAEPTEHGARPL